MTRVRIYVDTKVGDMEANFEAPLSVSESGVGYVRKGIIEAANRILRGYKLEEIRED